jgi:hypothetical protein
MVRVSAQTWADLNAYRGSLIRAYERGQCEPGHELSAEGITMDGAVRRLLRHATNDRRRMREAKRRRTERARLYRPSEE